MAENNHEKEAICFSKNLLIILLFGLIFDFFGSPRTTPQAQRRERPAELFTF